MFLECRDSEGSDLVARTVFVNVGVRCGRREAHAFFKFDVLECAGMLRARDAVAATIAESSCS